VYENMDKRGGQYKNTPGLFLYSHPFVFKKEWWNSVEMSHYFESLKDFTKQTRFSHNISLSEIQKLFRAQDLKAFYNYLKLDKLYFNGTEVDFYSYDNSSEDELYLLVEEKGEKLELTLKYSPQYFEYHNFLERLKHVVEQLLEGQEFQSFCLMKRERS
jgi:hypothetical protein